MSRPDASYPKPPEPVVITGATGFLGSHLVEALRAQGVAVRAIARATSRTEALEKLGVTVVRAAFDDQEALRAAVSGAGSVVHCAGGGKIGGGASIIASNADSTRALLEALHLEGAKPGRFVLISSLAAHGPSAPGEPAREEDAPNPRSDYGKSKLLAEAHVHELAGDIPTTILRFPAVYGPRDGNLVPLFRAARRGWVPLLGRSRTLSAVYVADAVDAIVRSLVRPHPTGRVYFVCHPEVQTQRSLVLAAAGGIDASPRFFPLPAFVVVPAGWIAELVARVTGRKSFLSRDKARDIRHLHWICSPERVQSELGWSARVPLDEGCRETGAFYVDEGWI